MDLYDSRGQSYVRKPDPFNEALFIKYEEAYITEWMAILKRNIPMFVEGVERET